MKTRWGVFFSVLSCLGLPGATAWSQGEGISEDAAALVAGNNRFGLDLYRQLADGAEGNVFISPWSISTAFAMTWAGARGDTAAEMAETLQFPFDQPTTHPLFGELIETLDGLQEEGFIALRTANAIWPAEGFAILPEYASILESDYHAHAESLDYRFDTEGSRQQINSWVSDQTEERIPELLPQGSVSPDTAIVLTNAVYFKGAWQTLFDPDETREDVFYADNGSEIDIDMMWMKEDLPFYSDEEAVVVTLPYHGLQMEAVLISPIDGDITALEAGLTPEKLAFWMKSRFETEVIVGLPRFSLRFKEELSAFLKVLGMQIPFTALADFSGIFGRPDLFISKVIHETFLQVKEEGTEAAAATGIVVEVTSGNPNPFFYGNRPFLFLIRDKVTGSLLFFGRVARPEPLEADPAGPDPEVVKSFFGEQATLTDGWWENTGIGRFQTGGWPWLRHDTLGWLYLDTATADPDTGFWLYAFHLGWLHTAADRFPDLWRESDQWLRYGVGTADPCWFYRYLDGEWIAR
ncbi:MAG: serpin family protein [Oceanipulchritudo sp.]